MPRPPFVMKPSRHAVLTCDGKFVIAGRASFVWETFLLRRAAGVPGRYLIRSGNDKPWHLLECTVEEAEQELIAWMTMFGKRRVKQMQKMRASRGQRGLPVG